MNYVKKIAFLVITTVLLPALSLYAYDVNLKGGSEIKEAAEIISNLMSTHAVKFFALLVLGFFVAFQGIRMGINGAYQAINGEPKAYKKGLLLLLMGTVFFGSGLVVIFQDELIGLLKPRKEITAHAKQTASAVPVEAPAKEEAPATN